MLQRPYDVDSDEEQPARREASAPASKLEDDSTLKRDEWMTMAPTADGLSRNLDPSKRARQFKSGPAGLKGSSSSGGGGMDATWTETPEEKRKRLQDQVMGVSA